MRIKADNRGRISLAQLGTGYSKKDLMHIGAPYSEWEAKVVNGQVTFTYAGEDAEPKKPEWVKIYPEHLKPEHVGQVIGLQARIDRIRSVDEFLDVTNQDAVWGVLESYSKGDRVEVNLRGVANTYTNCVTTSPAAIQYVIVKEKK